MRRKVFGKFNTSVPAILIAFLIFAMCVILALFTGAGTYRRLSERDMDTYNNRIGIQYVATKIRSASNPSEIFITNVDGTDILCIRDISDGYHFVTCIYYLDGWIRELFMEEGTEPALEFGEKIIEVRSLEFLQKGDLLTVTEQGSSGEYFTQYLNLSGVGQNEE